MTNSDALSAGFGLAAGAIIASSALGILGRSTRQFRDPYYRRKKKKRGYRLL